jgi:hypothetical protein
MQFTVDFCKVIKKHLIFLTLGLILFTMIGCGSMVLQTTTGFVASMTDVHRNGGAVNFHVNGGSEFVGVGPALRMKFTKNDQQIGLGTELIVLFPPVGPVTFYGRAGIHAGQFEWLSKDFVYGMFSPYGELGVMVRVYFIQLTASGAVDYSVRFGNPPNEGFWSFLLGVAVLWRDL